jgi:hypothetical protein
MTRPKAPVRIWTVVHEGKMLGAYDHDDTISGASAVARAVPGSDVVSYSQDARPKACPHRPDPAGLYHCRCTGLEETAVSRPARSVKASDGRRLSAERLAKLHDPNWWRSAEANSLSFYDEAAELLGHIAAVEAELAISRTCIVALEECEAKLIAAVDACISDAVEIGRLKAENARLREALEDVDRLIDDALPLTAQKVLRAALKGPAK